MSPLLGLGGVLTSSALLALKMNSGVKGRCWAVNTRGSLSPPLTLKVGDRFLSEAIFRQVNMIAPIAALQTCSRYQRLTAENETLKL